jgi:hypothetical protein
MNNLVLVEFPTEADADSFREVWEELRKHGYTTNYQTAVLLRDLGNATEKEQ